MPLALLTFLKIVLAICGPLWFHMNFRVGFIYLLIYGCVGSSSLCEGFLQLRRAGATLHRGARASLYRSLSCCGAQAPDAQAQQLWLTGPTAPRHVGSSQTRARTQVPCIGRQILNHCATREALGFSISVKNVIGILIVIAVHLQITLGNGDILTILSHPIHEHRICFHLLVSSLIYFTNVL